MKIAYLILAHDQPRMFKRLVAALDGPQSQFFVHIDRKCSQDDFGASCQAANITFERDRVWVNHSGFTQVLAMLRLLQVATSMGEFDYFVFLSGRDYPIKSNAYILKYLTEHKGTNFISFYSLVVDAEFSTSIRHRFFIDELAGCCTKAGQSMSYVDKYGLAQPRVRRWNDPLPRINFLVPDG